MNAGPTILVVEDNEDDVYFMRRALKAAASNIPTRFVANGLAALQYLRATAPFEDRDQNPFPSLVFLDLKLPLVHGLDVLSAIRSDPGLQSLPVYILTSSAEQNDRSRANQLGVRGYLVKPPSREMLEPIIGELSS
jgi:CheY-like chemotaxis protein